MIARVGRALGLAALFAALVLFRLATATISNDDYLHVSTAQQVLFGGVPVRDFLDPGELLFYSTSAAAQQLFGRSMLSEVLLDAVLLSLGQLLVLVLAARAARSNVVALLAAAFPIVIVARLYSYPKTFLYAVAVWLVWTYLDTRSRRVLWALSLWTGLSFLFRHDHGAYIGVTAAVMLVIAHWREWPALLRAAGNFAVPLLVVVIPFLIFVQVNGGLAFYLRSTLDTARGEYLRTASGTPVYRVEWTGLFPRPVPAPIGEVDPNVTAWLYHVTVLLPPLTVALLAWDWLRRRRGGVPAWRGMDHEAAKLTCAAVLGVLMHTYLLRAKSDSAVADVSALTGVLGAYVLARTVSAGRGVWRVLPAAAAVGVYGITAVYLSQSPGGDLVRELVLTIDEGRNPILQRLDSLGAMTAPYNYDGARYLNACTTESDRVLITSGYRPELYYAAGRGFAAGRLYYLNSLAPSPEFKAWSLERLRAERVPIVLMDPQDHEFAEKFEGLLHDVQEHYRPAGQVEFWNLRYDVLADSRIPPVGTWTDGLPCFKQS